MGLAIALGLATRPLSAARVIEVTGAPGTSVSTWCIAPAGAARLWLRVHGLISPDMASIRVNSGPWIPLNNTTCAIEGIAAKVGGIGGATDTVAFTLRDVAILPGARNTLVFRFNGDPEGRTAFRVLDVNVLDADGCKLIAETEPTLPYTPPNAASVVVPTTGTTTSSASVSPAAGEALWREALLRTAWTGPVLRARCGDCHAADGRDLKYFNYSGRSIVERARFHGLTSTEGAAIAAYVDANPASRLGQPWNPPYQPAPGLDAQPVSRWAAGGGLQAVQPHETATFAALFGGGAPGFDFSATVNIREVPVVLPLPDWNSWLPRVHPLDYWGDSFLPVDAAYKRLRNSSASRFQDDLKEAVATLNGWTAANLLPMNGDTEDSPAYQVARYSLALWKLVRVWDALQALGLEEQGRTFFPWPEAAARSWPGQEAFLVAPHMSMTRQTSNGLRDGTLTTWWFRSAQWYWLQMTLNDSNHRRNDTSPIDWTYMLAFASGGVAFGVPSEGMTTVAMAKAGEATTGDPYGPGNFFLGFNGPRLEFLSRTEYPATWSGYEPAWRDAVLLAYLTEYDRRIRLLGRDYFIDVTGEIGPADADNTPASPMAGPWIRSHSLVIHWYASQGYSAEATALLRRLGEYLWPAADWTR